MAQKNARPAKSDLLGQQCRLVGGLVDIDSLWPWLWILMTADVQPLLSQPKYHVIVEKQVLEFLFKLW